MSGYVAGVTHGEYKYVLALAAPNPNDAARMRHRLNIRGSTIRAVESCSAEE